MHNNFNDIIEERLRDLKDFETDIVDVDIMEDIWGGMENRLQTENSIYNLKSFEHEVPADIWAGIEQELVGSTRTPILWWATGIAASLLLFLLGTSQFFNENEAELLSLNSQSNKIENINNLTTQKNKDNNNSNQSQSTTNNKEDFNKSTEDDVLENIADKNTLSFSFYMI